MRLLAPAAVLAYLVAVAWLHPRSLSFDGIAFLFGAREGRVDYGHALYLPLLRAGEALSDGRMASERVAQLVSALGAALALALLWLRLARSGVAPGHAGLVAGCFALSTVVWQESGSIEPTTWTIAALLAAAEAAEAHARRARWGRLAALVLAFGAAVGFHLVSLCALPWLLALASPREARAPRVHLLVPLAAAVAAIGLAWLGGELGSYLRYWSGFVPDFRAGLASEVGWHVQRGARLVFLGAPVLTVLAVLAGPWLVRTDPRGLVEGACLGGPYLLAYLVLGKPLVGLLAPVLVAATFWVGSAAALAARSGRRGGVTLGLALALALQLALSVPSALVGWRGPDESRVRAELFARHVPDGALLFAGPVANHLRYYFPGVEVVSLPELWHVAHSRNRALDPIEVVREAAERSGRRCVLTSDGAGFLQSLGADPARLGLTAGGAFLIPEDPSLALFPLRG